MGTVREKKTICPLSLSLSPSHTTNRMETHKSDVNVLRERARKKERESSVECTHQQCVYLVMLLVHLMQLT